MARNTYAAEIREIFAGLNQRQRTKKDDAYKQQLLAERVRQFNRTDENTDIAQTSLDAYRDAQTAQAKTEWDYKTGKETISDPTIAKFLGVEEGAIIPRSQLGLLSGIREYENAYEKEEGKKKAAVIQAKLNQPIKVNTFNIGEVEDSYVNVEEDTVRESAQITLADLTTRDPVSSFSQIDALTEKAKGNPKDVDVQHSVAQLSNIISGMSHPRMREGFLGLESGDKTHVKKAIVTDSERYLSKLLEAQGHDKKKIQLHINYLKAKYAKKSADVAAKNIDMVAKKNYRF